jgi:hypothetical protein
MKDAKEILIIRNEKKEKRIKETQEQISLELLEIEKVLNKYETDIKDDKPYVTVPLIITTKEVKNLLTQNHYIIDKVSNDIEYGTTRIFLDEKEYEATLKLNYLDKKIKENQTIKIKCEPKHDNTSLNDIQRKYLKEQEYYPLKEEYFDLLGKITNIIREKKGEC